MTTYTWISRAALALTAAFALLLPRAPGADEWTMPLAEVAAHPDLALAPIPGADELDCASCHTEIAAEWSATLHAHAWIDPLYREMLATRRRPESCMGCHVPERLLAVESERFGRKPVPREESLEPHALGVSCRSCHEGPDGAMHGPYSTEGPGAVSTEAHASVLDERFVGGGSDALCASCHQTTVGPVLGIAKDFTLARLGERGASCVGCHMRPVERAIAVDPDAPDAEPYPVRAGRSHRLQTPRDPAFLAAGFELGARRIGDAVALSIANLAGHRVPGLVDRRLVFRIEALDAAGAVLARTEHVIDAIAYLPLEGSVDVRLAAAADALHVVGEHHAPGRDAPVLFLDRTLPVP